MINPGNLPLDQILQPKKSFSINTKKKALILIGIIFAILILFSITIFILTKKTSPKKPASSTINTSSDKLIATIGNQKIYRSDVYNLAKKQYSEDAINEQVLKTFYNLIVERKILDIEASKLGIKVTEQEAVLAARENLASKNDVIEQTYTVQKRYDLLKEKIMSKSIKSRTAFSVDFWTAGSSYDQQEISASDKQKATKIQSQAKKAFPQIEALIKQGTAPIDAVKKIMTNSKFSDLNNIIAVNGYIVSLTANQEVMKKPRIYTVDDKISLGNSFYDFLFSLKKGDVRTIFSEDGAIGKIFKVTDLSNFPFDNYQQWLQKKQAENLKIISSI